MRAFVPTALLALGVAAPALAQPQPMRIKTEKAEVVVETVARGLDHPWGLAFLPEGRMLVTERPGRLRIVSANGQLSQPLSGLPRIYARGQGGLLDVLPDRQFATDRIIYLSFAEDRGNGRAGTSVARARLNTAGTGARGSAGDLPAGAAPNRRRPFRLAPRLRPQGTLFVTLGDRFDLRDQAQDPANHIGKVVRITPEGGAPRTTHSERPAGAPGDLVHRPPQHPGRGAPSRKPATSGPPSTARGAATRSTSRAGA